MVIIISEFRLRIAFNLSASFAITTSASAAAAILTIITIIGYRPDFITNNADFIILTKGEQCGLTSI